MYCKFDGIKKRFLIFENPQHKEYPYYYDVPETGAFLQFPRGFTVTGLKDKLLNSTLRKIRGREMPENGLKHLTKS